MKICFLTHYSDMLGANHSLLILVEQLKSNFDVDIQVILPVKGEMESNLTRLNVSTLIIPFQYSYRSINLNWKGKIISFANLLKDYVSILKKAHLIKGCDIIYSNSSVISHGLILSRWLNIKHIWHIREYGIEDYSIVPIYGNKIQAFLAQKSERLIFISEHLKSSKRNWFKFSENAPVIYNGVPITKNKQEKPYDSESNNIQICFAGLMSEKKNAIEGLDLIELLQAANIRATLSIYSKMEGKYADKFIREAKNRNLNDKVKLMGFVENLSDSIIGNHFLIMPSRSEAMGRVSIEAMSVGIPVIGYKGGGTAELFEDGISGIYYKDIREVKDKIKSMDRNEYLRMSRNAQDTASDRFSPEIYGKQIHDLCKELIQKG